MREELLHTLEEFPLRHVAVIGDLIADEFLYGEISRISREAPVLVVQYKDLVRLPGGAANAANNLLDLGCQVAVAGVLGEDAPGRDLAAALSGKGADTSNLRHLSNYSTPVKTRILAGAHHSSPQQIIRVDRVADSRPGIPGGWASLQKTIRRCDAVILSDYGYGGVSPEVLDRVRDEAKRIPVVVDSRFRMSDFSGVTAITPNITELEACTGLAIGSDEQLLHKTGQAVLRRQKLESLLVTQGRYGMTLFQRRRPPVHLPIFGTDEVADVTGAGDTVIAVYALALACKASPENAARLANYAGGIVVMKRGTATVSREELRSAVLQDLA